MRVDLYDYRVCMAATHIRHQDVQSRSAADEDVYKASVAMCACCGAGNAFVSFRVPAVGIKALQAAHDGCIEDAALLATHVLFCKSAKSSSNLQHVSEGGSCMVQAMAL